MLQTNIAEIEKNNLIHVVMENDLLRIVVLPEIGGKMIELTNKKTGRQFLLEPQSADGLYRRGYYGANFEGYDTSGFDECFPTIESSEHPDLKGLRPNDFDIIFPDHGELWSLPWHYRIEDDALLLTANGVRFPYQFKKRISLTENQVEISYSLKNHGDFPFSYIWSAHPLLKVQPGARLVLSDEIERVMLNWASDENMGEFCETLSWPYLESGDKSVDYSMVQPRDFGKALKIFTDALTVGGAGVYFSDTDEHLLFQFDTAVNPYLGIWLCYGGWPEGSEEKHLTVGLEPCSGRPDSLEEAINRNEYSQIMPNENKEWQLIMNVSNGVPSLNGRKK